MYLHIKNRTAKLRIVNFHQDYRICPGIFFDSKIRTILLKNFKKTFFNRYFQNFNSIYFSSKEKNW